MTKPIEVYLGCAYSHPWRIVRWWRFRQITKVSAMLMRTGIIFYSPITSSHPMVKFGVPTHAEPWERQNFAFMDCCEELWVIKFHGWDKSAGLKGEIARAELTGIKIRYIDPDNLESHILNHITRTRPKFWTQKG